MPNETSYLSHEWFAIYIASLSLFVTFISTFFGDTIKKCIRKRFYPTKLNFILVDDLSLFFNKSGAYIRLKTSVQAINDNVTIKNIVVNVSHTTTKDTRILVWDRMLSLQTQIIGDSLCKTTSEVMPGRIMQDDIQTFKIEYVDMDNERVNKISEIIEDIKAFVTSADPMKTYSALKNDIDACPRKNTWNSVLSEEFFWKEASYNLEIVITDSFNQKYKQRISFSITKKEIKNFKNNIQEVWLYDLKVKKNEPSYFYTVLKSIADNTLSVLNN